MNNHEETSEIFQMAILTSIQGRFHAFGMCCLLPLPEAGGPAGGLPPLCLGVPL